MGKKQPAVHAFLHIDVKCTESYIVLPKRNDGAETIYINSIQAIA